MFKYTQLFSPFVVLHYSLNHEFSFVIPVFLPLIPLKSFFTTLHHCNSFILINLLNKKITNDSRKFLRINVQIFNLHCIRYSKYRIVTILDRIIEILILNIERYLFYFHIDFSFRLFGQLLQSRLLEIRTCLRSSFMEHVILYWIDTPDRQPLYELTSYRLFNAM